MILSFLFDVLQIDIFLDGRLFKVDTLFSVFFNVNFLFCLLYKRFGISFTIPDSLSYITSFTRDNFFLLRQSFKKVVKAEISSGSSECLSLYSSTKAAARYLVKALAHELAVRKINVNAISPGLINTAQFNEEMIGQKASNDHKMRIPAARFGEPDDIAGVVAFLASDEAEYINGQEIIIDGGLTSVH